MLTLFENYLTFENIYMWVNFGILPFWIMLIFIPNSKITRIFLNSIILPFLLSFAYIYIIYQAVLMDEPMLDVFKLYLSLDNLYTIFSVENFLLVFWLHFLALNIFLGTWVSRDAIKYSVPRGLVSIPLIGIYFSGPVGLLLYWFIRIFYAKKISFHD